MLTTEAPDIFGQVTHWPIVPVLARTALAVSMGVFIGLEREHSRKTGVRTFALVSMLGCLAGFMGGFFPLIAMAFVGMLVVGMNYREMVRHGKLVLTTSAAIMIVGFAGVLFGQGHVFTPAVAGVTTAALLAWKYPISRFAGALSDTELRSAILLAILTIIILPVLPSHPVDPWGLVEPRSNWVSVVIIAGMGFVNYILMKLLGARGMEITAFFGGLVNSRKIIVELGTRLGEVGRSMMASVERGILLATGAMIIRNFLIVAILALPAAKYCAIPLGVMLIVNMLIWWRVPAPRLDEADSSAGLLLESPFKLSSALKFGLMFTILNVVGALAQRNFGSASFYFVSIAGGIFSSASSIASAATLVSQGELPVATGVNGIILSSLTSILANIPFVRGLMKEDDLRNKVCVSLMIIAAVGLLAGFGNFFLMISGALNGYFR